MPRSPFSKIAVRQPVPAVGDIVQTVSGAWLGLVAETGENSFLVRGKNMEMWIREQSVFTRIGRYLTLVCEREGLPAYSDGDHANHAQVS
jgi:hypothetical protein